MCSPISHTIDIVLFCVSPAVKEKRGYRENRLLENLSKMVTEANDQLVALDTDSVNQGMITDLIRRCKLPF